MGQYGLPQKQPMTPGTPRVSPAIRELHGLLDTSVGELIKTKAPQYSSMLPADLAGKPLREIINTSNFLMRGTIMSYLEPEIRKMGLTPAQVEQAVKEAPPPPEPPAAAAPPPAVAAPPPAAAAAATAAPAAVAPPPAAAAAPAAPPPAASQYAPAPAAPAARGPTTQAAAALPQGSNAALDYLAQYGGHATHVRDGKKVNVHPGTSGGYGAMNPELAARLHAAGQAYERETGKKPAYGEASRGEDVQKMYWEESGHGTKYAAAPPGHSRHQKGEAMDLPGGGFRDWLNAGNKDRFGLHFPVKNDAPHVQINPAFKQNFATPAGPATPQSDVQAGAGPAAVAAARKADTAPVPVTGGGGANIPAGTSPETTAAINALATRLGVSPDAVAGVIKTESNFNPTAKSPGGKYQGLTQIGPDTFKEAGGKLGGLTYDEFLKASPDKQVAAYGGYLDHYKFGDKAKAAGVDFSKMSPAQQAAHLQAFQFSPAAAGWQGGDPNKPVTAAKQAAALGTTSLNDMTKYYDKLLAKSEAPDKGSTTTGLTPLDPTPDVGAGESGYQNRDTDKLVDPTPNVGSGEEGYKTPSFPSVDPTPDVGGGASSYGGGDAMAGFGGSGMDFGKMGGGVGDLFAGIADAFSKGPVAQNAASKSSPANAPLPTLPTPPGIMPTVDPKVADHQRQMLAMALQRLNSGKLV